MSAELRPGEEPGRVLVVDDETALAKVVANYLTREGFTVRLAHDGPSAVRSVREFEPALIVLDLMLPGFDGHGSLPADPYVFRRVRPDALRPR